MSCLEQKEHPPIYRPAEFRSLMGQAKGKVGRGCSGQLDVAIRTTQRPQRVYRGRWRGIFDTLYQGLFLQRSQIHGTEFPRATGRKRLLPPPGAATPLQFPQGWPRTPLLGSLSGDRLLMSEHMCVTAPSLCSSGPTPCSSALTHHAGVYMYTYTQLLVVHRCVQAPPQDRVQAPRGLN